MQALKSKAIVDHRFEIVEMLGAGGMGIVYKATQLELGRTVALKFLLPHLLEEGETLARFKLEAAALASLSHRNIILFYAYGVWHDRAPYIAMEYLDAPNLSELLISEGGKITWRRTLEIARQICAAISHAHAHGIVHRDLKPSNIFVITEDSGERVKVSDFGLAKIIDHDGSARQKLTATGFTLGSPHYMSPEQARGQPITGATDIYSVGCIIYECLFGRPPFDANTPVEILFQQSNSHLRLPEGDQSNDLPAGLLPLLATALAKDATARFPSMPAMAQAIETLLTESANAKDSKAKFSASATQAPPAVQRRNVVGRAIAIALVFIIGTALVVFANYGLLQLASQEFLLKLARDHGDYYEVADLELKEIALCATTNRSELKKQLQTALVTDAIEAVKSKTFQSKTPAQRHTFAEALSLALLDWSPSSGEAVERFASITNDIQNIDPQDGQLFSALILEARKPFNHHPDDYAVIATSTAISLLNTGPTTRHRAEIVDLFERAVGKSWILPVGDVGKQAEAVVKAAAAGDAAQAARLTMSILFTYCVESNAESRLALKRAAEALDSLPVDEKTQFTRAVVSNCNVALTTYYCSTADDGAVQFYKKAVTNERELRLGSHEMVAKWLGLIGHAMRQRGEFEAAYDSFTEGIKEAQGYRGDLVGCFEISRGDAMAAAGNWPKALEHYSNVAGWPPPLNSTHIQIAVNSTAQPQAMIFGVPHYMKSFESEAAEAMGNSPRPSAVQHQKAFEKVMHVVDVYMLLEKWDDALRTLDREHAPLNFPWGRAITSLRRGAIYGAKNQEDNCLSSYTKASEELHRMNQNNDPILLNTVIADVDLARAQRWFGHSAAAKELLVKLVQVTDGKGPMFWGAQRAIYLDMASLLASEGDSAGAIEFRRKVMNYENEQGAITASGHGNELVSLGEIAVLQKDFPKAELLFRHALNRYDPHDPVYPTVVESLAKLELRNGHRAQAKQLLTEAVWRWKMRGNMDQQEMLSPEYHDALTLLKSLS
jgi:serine/threonine protein kinase